MKVPPLTRSNPTNSDIVVQLNAVHECLDEHKRVSNRKFREQGRAIEAVNEKVEDVRAKINHMSVKLGTAEAAKPTVATLTQSKAFIQQIAATGSSFAGIFVVVKVAALAAPFILGTALALWKMVVG